MGVADFLPTTPPQAQAQFQQTSQLPAPLADQILAHGISTSFQLAVVFAVLALAVALVVIRAAAPEAVESLALGSYEEPSSPSST